MNGTLTDTTTKSRLEKNDNEGVIYTWSVIVIFIRDGHDNPILKFWTMLFPFQIMLIPLGKA